MRVYTSESEPLDFCSRHAPGEKLARERYGNGPDGPDGRGNCFGYDDDHPSYDDDRYLCLTCGCKLTGND